MNQRLVQSLSSFFANTREFCLGCKRKLYAELHFRNAYCWHCLWDGRTACRKPVRNVIVWERMILEAPISHTQNGS